jgi:4-hydroxy-tetrahydrodipicolinate synthase
MHLDATAHGVFPIAPTPFHADGRLDEASIDRLIEAYVVAGASGVTVLGIMGEAPKLEPDESLAIARRFIAGMGDRPVVVGVSAPGFAAMRRLSQAVMERGAAAVRPCQACAPTSRSQAITARPSRPSAPTFPSSSRIIR